MVCRSSKDIVEITSNDKPAEIMILYVSFSNHCAELSCCVDFKNDTKFRLLRNSTLVIIM